MSANVQQLATDLAENVTAAAVNMQTLFDLLFEQSDNASMAADRDSRIGACGNIVTLLNCAERYLKDIKDLCEEAQKVAKKGGA